jgi:hypothetical protein
MQARTGSAFGSGLLVVGMAALAPATAARGDGPGMLVYSTNQPPGTAHLDAPLRSFRAVGELGTLPNIALPMILRDGRPFVQVGTAAFSSAFAAIPPDVTSVSAIGLTTNFVIAITDTGEARAWGSVVPSTLPAGPHVDLSTYAGIAALVGARGQIHVFNQIANLPLSTAISDATRVSISTNWGVAVRGDQSTIAFGHSGATAPALEPMVGVRDVAVAGSSAAPRALAIRTDGSIASLNSSFTIAGDHEKISMSSARLMVLRRDSEVRHWTWDTGIESWNNATLIPGSYQDVAVPQATSTAMYAVCSIDGDRDGEPDGAQIARGEIPDVNGDGIDDRKQGASLLRDEDANGIVDATEVSAIGAKFKRNRDLWPFGPTNGYRFCNLVLDRVPPQAEAIRRIPLRHIDGESETFGIPPDGFPVTYGIWIDPNGDGSPSDAVQIWSADVVLEPDGSTDIEVDDLVIGPPGTVFFHGCIWDQNIGYSPAFISASSGPLAPTDAFYASRIRGRLRYGAAELASGAGMLDPGNLIRTSSPWDGGSLSGHLPTMPLVWGDRAAGDCDGDGMLDTTTLNLATRPYWIADPDLNANGVIDACEQDCDTDGVFDVVEILFGAIDCDLDLIPDECEGSGFSVEQTAPVPASGAPVEFTFTKLPPTSAPAIVTIEAVADLGAITESLLYRFENGPDTVIFGTSGTDCPAVPDNTSFLYSVTDFNAARADGAVRVRIGSSALVDPEQCAGGFVRVRISYAAGDDDCDENGTPDQCQHGIDDCDGNGVPDSCEVGDPERDINANGVLDACELDCDRNGVLDATELAATPSLDCDGSGYLDACEFTDCDANGVHDPCQLLSGEGDCNGDGIIDVCQELDDCDKDGIPDGCEEDCDANGVPDDCDIAAGGATDKDADGVPDSCEYARGDFDLDGEIGAADLSYLLSVWGTVGAPVGDLNGDGVIGAADLSTLLAEWGPLTP